MKKILVPTDFSTEAGYAFDVAVDIAKKTGAQIELLNVIDAPYSAVGVGGEIMPAEISIDQKAIEKMAQQIKLKLKNIAEDKKYKGIKITFKVDVDRINNRITEEIVNEKVDLLIMGSKGSSGLDEFLIGSNTEKVVRLAKCPVLVVKHKHASFDIKNIVFASDFTNLKDMAIVVKKLQAFASAFGSKVHFLRVNTPTSFDNNRVITKQMDEFAKKYKLSPASKNIYCDIMEEDGIVMFASENKMDMIALATHGRRGLAHVLSGSVAEDVVNHSIKPVLTLNINMK
jgi:nucleotide-binding universal stress UspA family protein